MKNIFVLITLLVNISLIAGQGGNGPIELEIRDRNGNFCLLEDAEEIDRSNEEYICPHELDEDFKVGPHEFKF